MGQTLVVKAWGPEFGSPAPTEKAELWLCMLVLPTLGGGTGKFPAAHWQVLSIGQLQVQYIDSVLKIKKANH